MLLARHDDDAAIVARYRTTPQFQRAWKIIRPSPKNRSQCEYWLTYAILSVPAHKELQGPPPAEKKRKLQKGAKKLRAAIPFALDPSLAKTLEVHARIVEDRARDIVVEKGKPPKSFPKTVAVHYAHALLGNFGSKPPTRHRKGAWHELAKVLCPWTKDLFDYMEDYRPSRPFPLQKITRSLADMTPEAVGRHKLFL